MRQEAIYQISFHHCDFSYIGETKRSFSIRKKEHLADIGHLQLDESALTKHIFGNEYSMEWSNAKSLDFELDFTKLRFIELCFISQIPKTMTDKQMTNSLAFIWFLYFKHHYVILLFFTLRLSVTFSCPIRNNFSR